MQTSLFQHPLPTLPRYAGEGAEHHSLSRAAGEGGEGE
jgi:hypothetical protein